MANGDSSKKWYSYFVTVDEGSSPQPQSTAPKGSGAAKDAAQAIADIAASVQPGVQQRVEQKFQSAPAATSAAAAPPAAGKTMSFNEIYAAAEIAPPTHGYTILKVSEMLDNPHIKELPSEVKRSSVLVALDAAGVKVQEVIEDAVRRDKALDAFERVQQKQIEDLEASKLEENRKLQTELDKLTADYKAKIQGNNESVAARKESFYGWRLEKQKMEQKISDAVSHLVTENPITTTASSATPRIAKTGI